MKRVLHFAMIALAVLLLPMQGHAAEPVRYKLVNERSTLKFFAIKDKLPLQGRFSEFSGEATIDAEKRDILTLKAEVKTGSIVLEDATLLGNVKKPDWLSVDAFPTASFEAEKLNRVPGSSNYYGDGSMTIRGKKIPATINLLLEQDDDDKVIARGYFTLRRSQFGLGQGEWAKDDVLKDEVRVEFRVVAVKA